MSFDALEVAVEAHGRRKPHSTDLEELRSPHGARQLPAPRAAAGGYPQELGSVIAVCE